MARPLRTAIFTGGHSFDRDAFFAVFDHLGEVAWTEFQQPDANALWESDTLRDYDAIVLYDLWQDITEAQRRGMVRWLRDEGKGLLVLHHSIGNYQHWDEYPRIIGARYFRAPGTAPDGRAYERSQWREDVPLTVQVLDSTHPVTQGLPEQFTIVDEAYKGFWVAPSVHTLLGTDNASSEPLLAWAHRYGAAKVVYLQLGHGPGSFNTPHFRTFVRNALHWVVER